MMPLRLLPFFIIALLAFQPASAGETREAVPFPPQVKAQFLHRMRGHLETLNAILGYLSQQRYAQASQAAQSQLGMGAMGPELHQQLPYMPPGMRSLGARLHKASAMFSTEAQNAEVTGDPAPALRALHRMTETCIACHRAYRVN
ncbi:MAG: hypothetical protein P8Y64_13800 [Gammaproteobacteria bacterium]